MFVIWTSEEKIFQRWDAWKAAREKRPMIVAHHVIKRIVGK